MICSNKKEKTRCFSLTFWVIIGILGAVLTVCAICVLPVRRGNIRVPDLSLSNEVQMACANYSMDFGCLPWESSKGVHAGEFIDPCMVLRKISGVSGTVRNPDNDYLGFASVEKDIVNGILVDSFGNALLFRTNPKDGKPVVWSCGANGIDETNDGKVLDPSKPRTHYCWRNNDDGDDLGHFD
jgi:hypothetical protein